MSVRHYECTQCHEVVDIICQEEEASTVRCPRCLSEARTIFPVSRCRDSRFYTSDTHGGNRRIAEAGEKQTEKPNLAKKGKFENNN